MVVQYLSYRKLYFNEKQNSVNMYYTKIAVESEETLIGFHVGDYFKRTFEWLELE